MQRQLPGRGDGGDRQSGVTERLRPRRRGRTVAVAVQGQRPPGHLPVEPLQRPVKDVAPGESGAHALGRVDGQRVGLPQRQQPQAVVEVAVRQHQARDRRVARLARGERGEALDLRADLGRDVQQEPGGTVGADRHRLLRPGPHGARPAPRLSAVVTAAVPLRHTATGRGTEDADFHVTGVDWAGPLAPNGVGRVAIGLASGGLDSRHRTPGVAVSEVAAVPTDFGAHVDLDEGRSFPLHARYSAPIDGRVKGNAVRWSSRQPSSPAVVRPMTAGCTSLSALGRPPSGLWSPPASRRCSWPESFWAWSAALTSSRPRQPTHRRRWAHWRPAITAWRSRRFTRRPTSAAPRLSRRATLVLTPRPRPRWPAPRRPGARMPASP